MHSYENKLPSTMWAWIGLALFVMNLVWTFWLIEATVFGMKCGMLFICMIMTVSISMLIGIIAGVAINAGVETYDEERQCLLARA